jgi:uncharacterized protein
MTATPDPLDALREPVRPVQPDPGFAERLRTRLEAALLDPRGAPMTENTTTASTTTPTIPAGGVGFASVNVPDLARGTAFYTAVFGWEYIPGGVEDSRRVANTPHEQGIAGGYRNPTTYLAYAVADLDATLAAIRAAGGSAGETSDHPYGRAADCTDDQGLDFSVYQPPGGPAEGPGQGFGDLVYLTYAVPDTAKFRAFYGAVFGWGFTPGRTNDGWGIEGGSPLGGVHGGVDTPRIAPMYAVTDVDEAVRRVRAAGGTATDPEQMPYGVTSDCADDQGSPFYLGKL